MLSNALDVRPSASVAGLSATPPYRGIRPRLPKPTIDADIVDIRLTGYRPRRLSSPVCVSLLTVLLSRGFITLNTSPCFGNALFAGFDFFIGQRPGAFR